MARKDVEPIQIHVPIGSRTKLRRHANSKGLELSAYIRGLIEADLKKSKVNIDLGVERKSFHGETEATDAADDSSVSLVIALAA